MQRIGVIGLGGMGTGIALSLQRAGFDVVGTAATAHTRDKASKLGISVEASVNALAAQVDAIVLSLPTPEVVRSVLTGPEGVAYHARPGLVVIDTSTSEPHVSDMMANRLAERGVAFIDAPVSGNPDVASAGMLTMMIGGANEDVAAAAPILCAISAQRFHLGPVGAGNIAKLANNMLAAAHFLLSAEIIRLAEHAGLGAASLLPAINASTGRSFITEHAYPKWILSGEFNVGFTMKLMRKDVRLALQLMQRAGLNLPLVSAAANVWAGSSAVIHDDEDVSHIVELGMRSDGCA